MTAKYHGLLRSSLKPLPCKSINRVAARKRFECTPVNTNESTGELQQTRKDYATAIRWKTPNGRYELNQLQQKSIMQKSNESLQDFEAEFRRLVNLTCQSCQTQSRTNRLQNISSMV